MNDLNERFEQLNDLLVVAAQYGPTPALESQYDELRHWMLGNWRRNPQPPGMRWHRSDAVEDLLSPPTLEGQLNVSGERLSQRLELSRAALRNNSLQSPTQAVH